MIAGPGHNNGPSLDSGHGWRCHAWTRARAELLPRLPIEVLRLRVRRAQELGLPYKTYASVRASTGRDVIGFLFSSNALRVLRLGEEVPLPVAERLGRMRDCARIAVTHPGISGLSDLPFIDAEHAAPPPWASWSEMRAQISLMIRKERLPADGLLMIGDTTAERNWSEAGRMAGYLTAPRFFDPAA